MDKRRFDTIHDAIQATREEPLDDFAAVGIWRDGEISVVGEAPLLQLKGYLHSGVWALAHADPGVVDLEKPHALMAAIDVRDFPLGRMQVVRLGGRSVGRGTFEPGWRWSECVQPLVGTSSCPLDHMGIVLSGRMCIRMDSGEEFHLSEGDPIRVAAGHDAWIEGDEVCEVLEVLSADSYALPAGVDPSQASRVDTPL